MVSEDWLQTFVVIKLEQVIYGMFWYLENQL